MPKTALEALPAGERRWTSVAADRRGHVLEVQGAGEASRDRHRHPVKDRLESRLMIAVSRATSVLRIIDEKGALKAIPV